ncbi:MAG: MGMT family protein [Chloroflexota bacterium]|nr:MGMT family protein [Chloroflexota bacterium]
MSDEVTPTQNQAASLMARVFALVQACPAGRVTTYGWIGKTLGYPRGARMIGWIMHETPEGVPAQRVVNSKGELSGSWAFGQRGRMRALLEAEGISFSADERIDLKRYGWDPSSDLTEEERARILATASTMTVDVNARLLNMLRDDPASPLRDSASTDRP